MKMRARKGGEGDTDINISPLIDMVFILLIFFIVTTVFVEEQGLQLEPPTPGPPPLNDDEPLALRLTESGRVFLNEREIPSSTVADELRAKRRADAASISLEVEPRAAVRLASNIVDQCRAAGFELVTLKAALVE